MYLEGAKGDIMSKSKLIQLGLASDDISHCHPAECRGETPAAKFADPKPKADLTPLDNGNASNRVECQRLINVD